MGDGQAGLHAPFFHSGHIGFRGAALLAFEDESGECGVLFRGVTRERVFWGYGAESDPHDGIGSRGIDPQLSVCSIEGIGEAEADAVPDDA